MRHNLLDVLPVPTIHCISGLGADHRVFQKLDIPGATLKPVPWPYFDKYDEMACYAQKVGVLIPEGPDDVILGLSFGGMLASEIARVRQSQKVIIVSSVKSPDELPPVSKTVRFVIEHKLMPMSIATLPAKPLLHRFGAYSEEEMALVRSILSDTEPHFARCASKAIIEWQTRIPAPSDIVHIHGTADQMLLPDRVEPTHWVEGGQHIMIYSKAEEVSRLIARHL
jgi:alpha/beta superfamily hydrolase